MLAENGLEALDLAAAELPVIFLLDVKWRMPFMPGLGSFEVCRLLKAHPVAVAAYLGKIGEESEAGQTSTCRFKLLGQEQPLANSAGWALGIHARGITASF